MKSIIEHLPDFIRDLEDNCKIVCKEQCWKIESRYLSFMRGVLGLENQRMVALLKAWNLCLDDLEKKAIKDQEIENYLTATSLVLSQSNPFSNHPQISKLRHQIAVKTVALKYRAEKNCFAEAVSTEDLGDFLRQASQWKAAQITFKEKSLNKEEIEKLACTGQYPEFFNLLKNPNLSHTFLLWVIKDKNLPEVFIQFPNLVQKLTANGLAQRIGRVNAHLLKIQKIEGQNIVSLKMEGRDINILDENQYVTFKGNYRLSVGEIFKIFKNKVFEVGNLEIMRDGIMNWNAHRLGFWNADEERFETISLEKHQWWHQLPFFEIISKKNAQKRYGIPLDGENWNVAAASTRESASLDFQRSHAFQEIAIPLNHQFYAIYAFGKFANKFPGSFFDSIKMLCPTVPASISFPDENVFYNHRQLAYYSFSISPAQGRFLMELIRQDIQKGRDGNLVYQIESDNCALWSQGNLERLLGESQVPNLYRMQLLDTEPTGFVNFIFKSIKLLPNAFQVGLLTKLHFPLGAWKGLWVCEQGKRVWKSLCTHFFWETGEIYLPAYVHKQQELGVLGDGQVFADKNVVQKFVEWLAIGEIASFLQHKIAPVSQKGKTEYLLC